MLQTGLGVAELQSVVVQNPSWPGLSPVAIGYHLFMNALSTDTITDNLSEALDAVTSTLEVIDVTSIADTVGETAADLADAAGTATVVGGRFVVRTARRGGRLVRHHPRGAVGTFGILLAVIALVAWYRRSEKPATSADLKVAA